MQMTIEARAWLDAMVRRILARHALGDAERAGITYELMSHLHAAGEARATAAGRPEVTREDLEAALAEAGGEEKLAVAFVQPLAKPVERVLFWRRAGAFALDVLVLGIALSFLHTFLEKVLMTFYPGWVGVPTPDAEGLWGLFPWGFHGTQWPLAVQLVIAVASGVAVLGYFTLTEAHDGRTLGKRALAIRVMRADGQPMTPRDALVRNLAKLQPFVLILDVIIMVLAFPKEKQRVSDRIADTIVVRA
ncbi:MAG: hypothetical protein QOE90_2636 [Thermoplasmata archaeon]|jgi:uncharacterized RDD family membrane protein YckC|nr:hypothetical protein [Thermoplasmata archaeon]